MSEKISLAIEIKLCNGKSIGSNPDGTQSQPGKGCGKPSASRPNGTGKNSMQATSFSDPTPKTEIRDRLGHVLMSVVDRDLEALHVAGLIDYHGRRTRVTHATVRNGVSVASLHATLRAGIRSALPRAEDCRTIQRQFVGDGAIVYTQVHVAAWDDGRPLGGTLGLGGFGFGGENERADQDDGDDDAV